MSGASSSPAAPEPGGDPSMEDILASIRRILNEEEPKPASDVLELTPSMRADPLPAAPVLPAAAAEPANTVPPEHPAPEPPPPAAFSRAPLPSAQPAPEIVPPPDTAQAPEPPSAPVPATRLTEHEKPREPVAASEPPPVLIAPAAAAAAAASMGELVRRLATTQHVPVARGGPTIEDIVRDEIRLLLKAWLDENLPRVVERLVQAEIERVVGRHVG